MFESLTPPRFGADQDDILRKKITSHRRKLKKIQKSNFENARGTFLVTISLVHIVDYPRKLCIPALKRLKFQSMPAN